MKLTYDRSYDIASLVLVEKILDGEIVLDVGPQLTPNRQWVSMAYDGAGYLLSIELRAASRILRPETLTSGDIRLRHDPGLDFARLHLTRDFVADCDLLVIGPQLTPTADRLLLAYDPADYLVYVDVEGAGRVLRAETLTAAS